MRRGCLSNCSSSGSETAASLQRCQNTCFRIREAHRVPGGESSTPLGWGRCRTFSQEGAIGNSVATWFSSFFSMLVVEPSVQGTLVCQSGASRVCGRGPTAPTPLQNAFPLRGPSSNVRTVTRDQHVPKQSEAHLLPLLVVPVSPAAGPAVSAASAPPSCSACSHCALRAFLRVPSSPLVCSSLSLDRPSGADARSRGGGQGQGVSRGLGFQELRAEIRAVSGSVRGREGAVPGENGPGRTGSTVMGAFLWRFTSEAWD